MAPRKPTLTYTVHISPERHHVEVVVEAPASARLWRMAVWTPGSYMVREYARHVEAIWAEDEAANGCPVRKVAKNRWEVASPTVGGLRLHYRLYGRELTVRTNHVEADFALLVGAATFLTPVDGAGWPHRVRLILPPGWQSAIAALPTATIPGGVELTAADFDTLVDTPLLLGNPNVVPIPVEGMRARLVAEGEAGLWDTPRAAADLGRLLAAHLAFWGAPPSQDYTMFNVLGGGFGGLEHRDSAVLMAGRWAMAEPETYLEWLRLASHEFFHAMNGKRLRPRALGPFDYEAENYTTSLWAVEGLTNYFDGLLVRRAGLCDDAAAIGRVGKALASLSRCPGRLVQPLIDSSFDAWIKYYRHDENSDNSGVSYYLKGSVVGFLLDAQIRVASGDRASLDDVMRLAASRFAGSVGYTEAEFRALCSEVAGTDLSAFLAAALDHAGELDVAAALAAFGLCFRPSPGSAPPAPAAVLGATLRVQGGRLVVAQVETDGPARAAGLAVDDELIAFDGHRPAPDQLVRRLAQRPAGTPVALVVARRERLVTLTLTPVVPPPLPGDLVADSAAGPASVARRRAWLSGHPA